MQKEPQQEQQQRQPPLIVKPRVQVVQPNKLQPIEFHKLKFNYTAQPLDSRDFKFSSVMSSKKSTPLIFTMENKIRTIYDQGYIGSCVSNSFAQCVNILTNNRLSISRLYHYYCGRAISGDSSLEDTGLDIRQAAKIISKYGWNPESVWPYMENRFNVLPSLDAFKRATFFTQYIYQFVNQDIESMKACLSGNSSPIIFGFLVYPSFFNDNRGVISLPNPATETLLGGHCMLIVGYNDTLKLFTCVNSWGRGWGRNGLCFMPYNYILDPNLSMDFCRLNIRI